MHIRTLVEGMTQQIACHVANRHFTRACTAFTVQTGRGIRKLQATTTEIFSSSHAADLMSDTTAISENVDKERNFFCCFQIPIETLSTHI